MALETATYISDLVSTNPTTSDPISLGDDHIRLLKSSLKTTFPNVSGAVLPTHTELNYVDGVTSSIQTQLDAKAPLASPTFTGTVGLPATTSIGNVSATEISYLDGTIGALQPQIDLKANTSSLGSLATLSAVGTSQITDSSITTGKIANNAVDGTKIAMGSDVTGDILYYNGTDYTRLAAGTAGQVLQTNGTSGAPTWVTPTVGGMVLLGTLTMSGASQTLSGLTLTSYVRLYVVISGVSFTSATTTGVTMGNSSADDYLITNTVASSSATIDGYMNLDLVTGIGSGLEYISGAVGYTDSKYAITKSSTALYFGSSSTPSFDAGTITVYGVK